MALVSDFRDPPVVERTFADFNEYYGAQHEFWGAVEEMRLRGRRAVVVTWESPAFHTSEDFHGAVTGHGDFMRALRDASMLMGSDQLHQYFSGIMPGSDVTFRVYQGSDVSHRVTRKEDVRYR